MSGNGCEPECACKEEVTRVESAEHPVIDQFEWMQALSEERTRKLDFYDPVGDKIPHMDPKAESNLHRERIEDRQSKPPTSKLLASVMKYDPARPRQALWEAYHRREQAPKEVVTHPVKDLQYYKLRNCITCAQREKQQQAEEEADPYAPSLHEFLVDDLVDGLTMLVGKVRSMHQEAMCVTSFMNMYMNNHFGNAVYANYDTKKTQEELRKFCRLLNCHAETMKCMEMFCTSDQLDGLWRNAGLTSIYEKTQNEISVALKKKTANDNKKLSSKQAVGAAVAELLGFRGAENLFLSDTDDVDSTEDDGEDDTGDVDSTEDDGEDDTGDVDSTEDDGDDDTGDSDAQHV